MSNTRADDHRRVARLVRWLRVTVIVMFASWVAYYIRNTEPLLHGSLLVFHEAGHVLFMPFGEFTMVLGGSLFEIMMPAIFVAYFARRRDVFATCFACLYLAAAFASVGTYIADARAGELPLLGGERSNHDWTFLLVEMERLDSDIAIGTFVRSIAWTLWCFALATGVYAGWMKDRNVEPETATSRPAGTAPDPAKQLITTPWKER